MAEVELTSTSGSPCTPRFESGDKPSLQTVDSDNSSTANSCKVFHINSLRPTCHLVRASSQNLTEFLLDGDMGNLVKTSKIGEADRLSPVLGRSCVPIHSLVWAPAGRRRQAVI